MKKRKIEHGLFHSEQIFSVFFYLDKFYLEQHRLFGIKQRYYEQFLFTDTE